MRYVSTRGTAPALDFRGATLAGLASDGGLYLPENWPTLSRDEIASIPSSMWMYLSNKQRSDLSTNQADALFDHFAKTRAIRRSIVEQGQDDDAADFGRAHP